MGLIRLQVVGEGMTITGRERTIDITIKRIIDDPKIVELRVKGVPGLTSVILHVRGDFQEITDGIKIAALPSGYVERAMLDYDGHDEYRFDRKDNP